MAKAEGLEGTKNPVLHGAGKYAEEIVMEAEAEAGVSGNDTQGNEDVVAMLQQIDYSINQNGQVLTVIISILAGLVIGVIFTVWFGKVWK